MQYDKRVQSESRTLSLHHSRARDHCAADIKQKGLKKAATLVGFFPSSPRNLYCCHCSSFPKTLGNGFCSMKLLLQISEANLLNGCRERISSLLRNEAPVRAERLHFQFACLRQLAHLCHWLEDAIDFIPEYVAD